MMKKFLAAAAAVAVALVALIGGTAPAQAAHTHYGEGVRKVAREIGCKHLHDVGGPYDVALSTGTCRLKGHRVFLVTFTDREQQSLYTSVLEARGERYRAYKGAVAVR